MHFNSEKILPKNHGPQEKVNRSFQRKIKIEKKVIKTVHKDYIFDANRQFENTEFYQKIPNDPTESNI